MEVKPVSTRKLRRRPNDPMPVPEKRRKASPAQLNVLLQDDEIMEDLRILNKISGKPLTKKPAQLMITNAFPSHDSHNEHVCEARIDDGRLVYEKKWLVAITFT
jgi:Sin3 histone deacetylase corepressor complex component SDS3